MKQLLKNIFPGFYGLLNYFTIRLLQDTNSHSHFWMRPWAVTAGEVVMSFIVGYVVLGGVHRICSYTDHKAGGTVQANFITELWYVIALSVLVNNVVLLPVAAFTDDGLSLSDQYRAVTVCTYLLWHCA